ncbi:sensor histidine kinase [Undibacterium sp. TC4M20W]|uniref:sensor histidine kinase n=1 Tax=Undibacterium sp. TC4M20W TaxID=3413052 RepID=UPI003BF37550
MTLATDQSTAAGELSPISLQFISIREAVMARWEQEIRARVPGASSLLGPVLINTLPAFYDNIAEALSPDYPRKDATSNNNAASVHGGERARMTLYGPDQVIHEYQIFREIIAIVAKGHVELTEHHWTIIDQSINTATREAIRAFTASHEILRGKLAAALSHDMRTPLAVIANGAQLISMTTDMEVAKKFSSKIASNAKRLGAMMGELVDALTLQGNTNLTLDLSQFDLSELASEVCDQYYQNFDCNIGCETNEAVIGYWCKDSLRRALENLINNAIKYGDNKTVSTRVHQAHGRLMLSVHNMGNPIPKDMHNNIFDYLRREDNVTTTPSWGIGLHFVKTVAESHGGSVLVDSSEELGTTFLIDIPVDCRPFVPQS